MTDAWTGGALARARSVAASARRRAAALLRGPRPQPPGALPPPVPLRARVEQALATLEEIERREDVLPAVGSARVFLVRGRAVTASDLGEPSSELVPHSLRGPLRPGGKQDEVVSAPVAADVLAVAKFDLEAQAKWRAHYVRRGLTVAAQPARGEGHNGVLNAVRAHAVVSRHAPGLCPHLLSHGTLEDGVSYLVERWVDGVPVTTSQGLAAAAPAILEGLAMVHRGYGLRAVPASRCWGGAFAERWARTRATGLVPAEVGERVAALAAADRSLRVSWTHGDLVASNVLRTADGQVVLIDWEHAHDRAIMQDVAKLHLFSATPGQTLDTALEVLGAPVDPTAYTAAEELTLAHAHFINGYLSRKAALEGHARARVYERQVQRQLERLTEVSDRAGS